MTRSLTLRRASLAAAAILALAPLSALAGGTRSAPPRSSHQGGSSHVPGGSSRGPGPSSHSGPSYRSGPSRHSGPSYHSGSSYRYRGSSHYRYRPRVYWGSSWGWGWGPYWGWGGPWGYGYGWPGRVYVSSRTSPRVTSSFAVVDTDVTPEEAEVWLDGKLIGSADDFDGNPDFLYLQPGKYKLEFRLPGYVTRSLDLDVARGESFPITHELELEKGHGKLDSFLPPAKGTPMGRVFGPGAKPVPMEEPEEQRPDRVGRFDADDDDDEASAEPPAPKVERKADRARIRWKVSPDDAAVYLDDRLFGTADDLTEMRSSPVPAGKHTIVVTRPGYKSKTVEVTAEAGKTLDVVVELER